MSLLSQSTLHNSESLKTVLTMKFPLQKLKSLILILFISHLDAYTTTPLNCTETSRLCTSFLAFSPSPNQSLPVIMSMFDVVPQDVTVNGNFNSNENHYVFVKKNCSCANSKYLTHTTYTVRESGGSLYETVVNAYGGLGYLSNFTRVARAGEVVGLQLLCGCSNGLWNYLMSYVMKEGDSIEFLASKFGVSMDSIESVNGISDSDNVTVGAVYYIPLNSGKKKIINLLIFSLILSFRFKLIYD